ncbi:hypothetical protein I0P70_21050 [Pontibacter sp. FD36]|uniref:hypothetical protein n=1 Tax=Pontibacter sp. FD36 TaxID=2789860 RepID=UPI0018AA908F|nr:hypothetical protein [Pontibacter sp. FD36]MBF8965753.1 hypothetical protein [Pontibacter sp. FD36]
MAYFVNLFSPDTLEAFNKSDQTISGFREGQRSAASKIKVGDRFICYVTRLSRWIGILEVTDKFFVDDSPIFLTEDDPFILRFKVKPLVWLPLNLAVPIYEDICWENLTFTADQEKTSSKWTSMVRGSLRKFDDTDGQFLEQLLYKQTQKPTSFPLSDSDKKKSKGPTVKTQHNKKVTVSIPENDEAPVSTEQPSQSRDSIKIQGLLAGIGERMNYKIWIPKNDRSRVLEVWSPIKQNSVLQDLPLNYDSATLKTIENIDILWIKGRSIIRAFEVEHTTSIYSGILRMADLMALQPNLKIQAHIVAPNERKEKVLQEITRPVFTFLESGPLSESCTFISYDSVEELAEEKRLEYMTDAVLEEFSEVAEDSYF